MSEIQLFLPALARWVLLHILVAPLTGMIQKLHSLKAHSNQSEKEGKGPGLRLVVFVLLFTHNILEATDSSFLQRSVGNSNSQSGEPKPSPTEKAALVLMVCMPDKQVSEPSASFPSCLLPLPCDGGPTLIFEPLLPSFQLYFFPFSLSGLGVLTLCGLELSPAWSRLQALITEENGPGLEYDHELKF